MDEGTEHFSAENVGGEYAYVEDLIEYDPIENEPVESTQVHENTMMKAAKDANVHLPKFENSADSFVRLMNWQLWKNLLCDYFVVKPSIQSTAMKLSHMRLGGGTEVQKALMFFKAKEDPRDDEFIQAIKHLDAHFKCGVNEVSLVKRFQETAQRELEPFNMFAQRLIMIGMLAGITQENHEAQLIAQLMKGASNKSFVQQASYWTGKPLSEVIQIGTMMDQMQVKSAEQKPDNEELETETIARMEKPSGSNYRKGDNYYSNHGGENRSGDHRYQPYSSRGYRGRGGSTSMRGKCFNCNKPGHFARDCYSGQGSQSRMNSYGSGKVRK